MFAEVILPVKFHGVILYNVPEGMHAITSGNQPASVSENQSSQELVGQPASVSGNQPASVSVNQPANVSSHGEKCIREGSWVNVDFGRAKYAGVVRRLHGTNEADSVYKLRDINGVLDIPPVSEIQMNFWEDISKYYLCTVGEVMKAALPNMIRFADLEHFQEDSQADANIESGHLKSRTARKSQKKTCMDSSPEVFLEYCESLKDKRPELSEAQIIAYNSIVYGFSEGRRTLLHGVTGSGKTEIYISLAIDTLLSGHSVLMLVPEISLSKQLNARLKSVFGDRLLLYNSKVTPAGKARVQQTLWGGSGPFFVLGTRSALFLPFRHLGLIVVDEEHDNSYKQEDPAPRYNARDVAIMLSAISQNANTLNSPHQTLAKNPAHSSKRTENPNSASGEVTTCVNLLLGSATPSYESLYNVRLGKLDLVNLNVKYYSSCNATDNKEHNLDAGRSGRQAADVTIIDTLHARFTHQMKGSFSQQLINRIRKVTSEGQQVLVLKNRRSYAPMVECSQCGEPAICPHCNVMLSYHKSDNTLRCHYCEYARPFENKCRKCGNESMVPKGTGTEKIEEELEQLFPELAIGRFDADVTKSKREEEKVLQAFDSGQIKILTGTQMITKGFDFKDLKLVAVLGAEQILGLQDFRADEKAFQMFYQLLGRAGRRGQGGELVIQSTWKDHPVLARLKSVCSDSCVQSGGVSPDPDDEMQQRKTYLFPPYSRLVKLIARGFSEESVNALASEIRGILDTIPSLELTGPFSPQIDRIRGVHLKCFYIKFARNKDLASNKRKLFEHLEKYVDKGKLVIDVDPL